MFATNLSVKEIENILVNFLGGVRTNIMVPNLSWGLLNHEADFVSIDKNGYLTEVEIKRSFEDSKLILIKRTTMIQMNVYQDLDILYLSQF